MSNQIPISESEQVKLNMQNIRDEMGYLILHKEVVKRKIEECKKVFESKIVIPTTRNISAITAEDLKVDLVPVQTASMQQINARYEWYHLCNELAEITAAIEAKQYLLKEYQDHLAQYFRKEGQKITDEMIYEKLSQAQSLKPSMSPEELATLEGLITELPKRLNGSKQVRLELYEALSNLILQHG